MEKEQIIKALECCTSGKPCRECEYKDKSKDTFGCRKKCLIDALALIKEQGEQIFKLEKRLEECESGYSQTLAIERAKVRELTDENERFIITCEEWSKSWSDNQAKWEAAYDKLKADTVREMQEALKERIQGVYLDEGEMCAIIDEVAGKILNGNTEGKSD